MQGAAKTTCNKNLLEDPAAAAHVSGAGVGCLPKACGGGGGALLGLLGC